MRGDWFTTGDRFERREDGAYVFVGRTDEMLKAGGLWVSPIDMEHVIVDHPEIAGAGVVGVMVDDASRIAAFVERRADGTPDDELAEELRAMCKERLRRYEYPHVVHFVESCRARPAARCSASSCARWLLRAVCRIRLRHPRRLTASSRGGSERRPGRGRSSSGARGSRTSPGFRRFPRVIRTASREDVRERWRPGTLPPLDDAVKRRKRLPLRSRGRFPARSPCALRARFATPCADRQRGWAL